MLLTTKFLRPTCEPRAVQRDRLSALLEPQTPKRLNVVIAPAGFGKTTLVAQWCSQTPAATAWLSLDEHDDEPRRFWQYLLGAFEHAGLAGLDGYRRQLGQNSEESITAVITGLINLLSQDTGAWCLVLDDLHLIQDLEILRQLAYFVDYLPGNVTVTLASRTEPPLPLARWRVRRWVADIHPGLIAFSEAESRQFFRNTMALNIPDAELDAIFRRTEGWVAAMQLSALSSRAPSGADNQRDSAEAAVGRLHLEVNERQISDYVLAEVLGQQSDELAQFLLDTACCPRLCASLCDAIRGADDSQQRLEQLLKENLFLIPLDTQNGWFRYHDLFRDALLQRLRQTDPGRASELWQRTVAWLLDHGHVQEGIALVVYHQDWPWLAQVLAEHGNNLIHGGFHLPVLEWLQRIPEPLLADSPQLQMLRIWGLFFANRVDSLEPLLGSLEDLLDRRVADSHPDAGGAIGLQSEVSLIRSYLARTRSDEKSASDLTRQVLEDIDHTRIPLKSVTYYGIGLDYYGQGRLSEAEDALLSSVRHGQVERKPSTVLSSGGLLAWIQFSRGDIDMALDSCTEVRHWVDQHYADPSQPRLISCWQNSALTQIYRERNELTLAKTHLAPLLEHVAQGTEPGQHVVIQYVRGHLAFSEGQLQEAIDALEDAVQVGRRRRDQIVFEPPASSALLARCYLASGHPDKAWDCLEAMASWEHSTPLNRDQNLISKARVLVAQGQTDKAQDILAPLLATAERNANNRHLVEILLVYGEALEVDGQREEALEMLKRAVSRAQEAGLLRLVAEESERLRQLLTNSSLLATPGRWHQSLLELLREQQPGTDRQATAKTNSDRPRSEASSPAGERLPEPLSQREMEVLALINEGHANKEIARVMQVAPATVKAHIRNLYGKLGVSRRTEALARARHLALLKE